MTPLYWAGEVARARLEQQSALRRATLIDLAKDQAGNPYAPDLRTRLRRVELAAAAVWDEYAVVCEQARESAAAATA